MQGSRRRDWVARNAQGPAPVRHCEVASVFGNGALVDVSVRGEIAAARSAQSACRREVRVISQGRFDALEDAFHGCGADLAAGVEASRWFFCSALSREGRRGE